MYTGLKKGILLFTVAWHGNTFAQTICVVNTNQAQTINLNSKKLLGVSFDGRASMDMDPGSPVVPAGYYDPTTGSILPAVQPLWNRVPMGGTRYPGNLEIYNWNWSYTIGPVNNRISQPMGPGNSLPQVLQFGFDEFMAMTATKGLASSDVQIMVNLYPSVGQSNPAILAADWVEYCNAPNNGSNPRGGTDWAALRASYGHPAPYGIKTWNIGNEPWSSAELGSTSSSAKTYIGMAIPIIDSMLSADPTIRITIPSVGNASSPWNDTLLASSALLGRIFALSPHAFYDEDLSTSNPSISLVQSSIASLANAAQTAGIKVVAGDHASWAPSADPDKAMRWEGALTTADYLLMLSQVSNVELANFWIYGNAAAVWHPIRNNQNGTYTLMAAAQLYESFYPVFYDQSFTTTITDTGGNPVPSVRASSFKSNDGSKASVISINTHLTNDYEMVPPVLSGFTLQSVKLITASSINNDTSITTVVLPLVNGNYRFPHTGVLISQYGSALTSVEQLPSGIPGGFALHQNYPNPFNPATNIEYDLPKATFISLKIFNILCQEVATLTNEFKQPGHHQREFNASALPSGIYFYRLIAGDFIQTKKLVLLR